MVTTNYQTIVVKNYNEFYNNYISPSRTLKLYSDYFNTNNFSLDTTSKTDYEKILSVLSLDTMYLYSISEFNGGFVISTLDLYLTIKYNNEYLFISFSEDGLNQEYSEDGEDWEFDSLIERIGNTINPLEISSDDSIETLFHKKEIIKKLTPEEKRYRLKNIFVRHQIVNFFNVWFPNLNANNYTYEELLDFINERHLLDTTIAKNHYYKTDVILEPYKEDNVVEVVSIDNDVEVLSDVEKRAVSMIFDSLDYVEKCKRVRNIFSNELLYQLLKQDYELIFQADHESFFDSVINIVINDSAFKSSIALNRYCTDTLAKL